MIAVFPELANLVEQGDIERLACKVREYFGGEQRYAPWIPLGELCNRMGAAIKHSDSDESYLKVADRQGRFTAEISTRTAATDVDNRFITAHLLGHFFIHIQPRLFTSDQDFHRYQEKCSRSIHLRRNVGFDSIEWSDLEEKQADLFALALLLPMGMFQKAYSKLRSVESLSRLFGLEQVYVTRRIEQLKLGENTRTPAIKLDEKIPPIVQQSFAPNTVANKQVDLSASPKGLERLRRIAHRLDQSVEI